MVPGGGGIERLSSGGPWEARVGYARVVRAGALVFVSGTTGTDAHGAVVGGGAAAQTRQAIANIARALDGAGARLSDVVQTRLYVRDIDAWEEVGREHAAAFGAHPPAAAMVEVTRLIHPDMLVEVEAVAWVGGDARPGAA